MDFRISVDALQNHTSPWEVGAIFQQLQPRLAIATHLKANAFSIVPAIAAIRSTYPSGPLAVAQDLSVWDVTADAIVQRQVCWPSDHYQMNMSDCNIGLSASFEESGE